MTFNPGASTFRLRFSVPNIGALSTESSPFELYVSKNGGTYTAITTTSTSGVKSADASTDVDNTALTTPRLTKPL